MLSIAHFLLLLTPGALGVAVPAPGRHSRLSSNSTPTSVPASTPAPASGSGFNVKTYYGGADFPFTLSQDQAPRMEGTDFVDLHNQYRALHGAKPMTHSDDLQSKVDAFVAGCPTDDPQGASGYGSNWFIGPNATPADAMWWLYNERANFTAMTNDFTAPAHNDGYAVKAADGSMATQPMTMHFTQMVWDRSTTVACQSKSCPQPNDDIGVVYVCFYAPPGNIVDNTEMLRYQQDVFKPSR